MRFRKFFCGGCGRWHGRYVFRTTDLDGQTYCDRAYNKRLAARWSSPVRAAEPLIGALLIAATHEAEQGARLSRPGPSE